MSFILAPQLVGRRGPGTFQATGGIEQTYTQNNIEYKSHTFLETGDFTVISPDGVVDILVISGGGAGVTSGLGEGGTQSGAGGAGGMVVETGKLIQQGVKVVTIGGGGASQGQSGTASSISDFTYTASIGGGRGGSYGQVGGTGGSGGGAGTGNHGGIGGGAGTAGQGNNGGNSSDRDSHSSGGSGGGGGAGGAGGGASRNDGGDGGPGLENDFRTGALLAYAGGGGGSHGPTSATISPGGIGGGGGQGGESGMNGAANKGGGGAAMSNPNGLGGSGIVVIRYDINQVQPAP